MTIVFAVGSITSDAAQDEREPKEPTKLGLTLPRKFIVAAPISAALLMGNADTVAKLLVTGDPVTQFGPTVCSTISEIT